MKEYFYSCDGGCIAIAIGKSIIKYCNSYGDGSFSVYITDTKEFNLNDAYFIIIDYFENAYVLDYDCVEPDKIKEHRMFKLEDGEYFIMRNRHGDIYFVKRMGTI